MIHYFVFDINVNSFLFFYLIICKHHTLHDILHFLFDTTMSQIYQTLRSNSCSVLVGDLLFSSNTAGTSLFWLERPPLVVIQYSFGLSACAKRVPRGPGSCSRTPFHLSSFQLYLAVQIKTLKKCKPQKSAASPAGPPCLRRAYALELERNVDVGHMPLRSWAHGIFEKLYITEQRTEMGKR